MREKLAFSSEPHFEQGYQFLRDVYPGVECVIVSTCNRIEIYMASDSSRGGEGSGVIPSVDQLVSALCEFHHISIDGCPSLFRQLQQQECLQHLFEVSSSLDSMVLGEDQIVYQVKTCYERAHRYLMVGPGLHHLFQSALNVASLIRKKTRLSEGKTSIASVAVGDFGKSIFDDYVGKHVLVIGAGEMAQEALQYLHADGIQEITVINRTHERAIALAERFGGRTAAMEDLDRYLADADIIVTATGAPAAWIDAERMKLARKANRGKTQFVLDLGAPRDFLPDAGKIDDNLFLFNIDDLNAVCQKNRQLRAREVERARKLISEQVGRCLDQLRQRHAAPIIQTLRNSWQEIGHSEFERLAGKLSHLAPEDLSQIEMTIERVLNKLLHHPMEALRQQSLEESHESFVETLKRLFRLTD